MRAVLFLLAVFNLCGQSGLLSPAARFDLKAGLKHRVPRYARVFFAATPNGLTLVIVGDHTSIVSADVNGRILHTTPDVTSVLGQIYRALLLPDGRVWVVAEGPYDMDSFCCLGGIPPTAIHSGGSSSTPPYNQLDLYSADGKHLSSVRLLSEAGPLELPIAAAGDVLVVLAWLGYGTPETELIRFGKVSDGKFHQSTTVQFKAPFRRTVPVLAANGNLFLIDRIAGSTVVIDPKAGRRSLLRPVHPYPVNAAAADSDFLYLLSSDSVLKIDLGGTVLTTYRFQFDRGFRPVTLGATGDDLYLVDRVGRTERFQLR